jgi:hypothetical protein
MRTWAQVVATSGLVLWLGTEPASAGQSPTGAVCVVVIHQVDVSEQVLADALVTAARLFKSIGVPLVSGSPSGCRHSVVVKIVSGRQVGPMDRSGTALGFAIIEANIAYVVHDRIERYAVERRVPPSDALGLVIAHEVGHLLIGRQTHTDVGLMRQSWTDDDFRRAANGLGFTSENARTIQQRLVGSK